MPGISSTIRLNDGMSAPLRRINSSLTNVISRYERLQAVSGRAINVGNMTSANEAVVSVNVHLEQATNETEQLVNQQQRYNNLLQGSHRGASALLSKIKGIAAGYLGLRGLGQLVNLSDTMASNQARLSLIVDDKNSVDTLKAKIYASAQAARGSYTDTMESVAKMGLLAGKAFSNNDQIIRFTELMNKNFAIGGSSAVEQASAMRQLTQAMASGRLQGDEYVSIIENAPLLARSIEDYMINVRRATGSMKEWASEGLLTANVIKAAMFSTADEVDARLNNMPMTWAQVWTSIKNTAIRALDPVLKRINELANSDKFKTFTANLETFFSKVADAAYKVLDAAVSVFNFVSDNWPVVEPIIWGIVAAMTALSVAQWAVNIAMYSCPLFWIVAAIIIFIAEIVAVVVWTKKWIDSMGGISNAWLFIKDSFITVGDMIHITCLNVVNWVMTLFTKLQLGIDKVVVGIANRLGDMRVNSAIQLQSMINGAISMLNFFIGLLNKIPGVNIGFIQQATFATQAAARNEIEKQGRADALSAVEGQIAARENYIAGVTYEAGRSHAERLAEINANKAEAIAKNAAENKTGISDILSDYLSGISDDLDRISDSMNKTDEDLSYLRDIAEQEAINRFTTAEVKVDFAMSNKIDSSTDVDGLISVFTERFKESLTVAAEGSHA